MRILILTRMHPAGLRTGGEVVSQAVVEALRTAGHTVVVVGYRRQGTSPPLHPDDVLVGDRRIETRDAGLHPAGWMLRAVITRRPYSVAKFVSRDYLLAAQRAAREQPAFVVLDHLATAWALPRLSLAAPYAYLAHNVEHRLHSDARGPGGAVHRREAQLLRRTERAVSRGAARVWALTEPDAQVLRSLGAEDRVRVLAPPASPVETASERLPDVDVRLLGTWTWRPNAEGLRWFVDEVVPRLPDDMVVEVGGSGAERICGEQRRVRCVGRVPDAAQFLRGARAVAVPSTAGEGVQVKTLDALAAGVPVVATDLALRGIASPPPTVARADGPEAFARGLEAAVARGPALDGSAQAREWSAARLRDFRRVVADEAARLGALPHAG